MSERCAETANVFRPWPTHGQLPTVPRTGGNLRLKWPTLGPAVHSSPIAKPIACPVCQLHDVCSQPSLNLGHTAPESPNSPMLVVSVSFKSTCEWIHGRNPAMVGDSKQHPRLSTGALTGWSNAQQSPNSVFSHCNAWYPPSRV